MKFLIILAVFVTGSYAHARQYIQCSSTNPHSWDAAVVNLDGNKSTLFMTTGVHDPDELRELKDLTFVSADASHTIYRASNEISIETVILPTEIIGKASNSFPVSLEFESADRGLKMTSDMICFSALYLP